MTELIDLADHPHNLDPTARLVWFDTKPQVGVYSVRAGFIATFGLKAFAETFASLEAARQAIWSHVGTTAA